MLQCNNNINHTCGRLSCPKLKKKLFGKIKIQNFEFEAPTQKFPTLTGIFWLNYISKSYYKHFKL